MGKACSRGKGEEEVFLPLSLSLGWTIDCKTLASGRGRGRKKTFASLRSARALIYSSRLLTAVSHILLPLKTQLANFPSPSFGHLWAFSMDSLVSGGLLLILHLLSRKKGKEEEEGAKKKKNALSLFFPLLRPTQLHSNLPLDLPAAAAAKEVED